MGFDEWNIKKQLVVGVIMCVLLTTFVFFSIKIGSRFETDEHSCRFLFTIMCDQEHCESNGGTWDGLVQKCDCGDMEWKGFACNITTPIKVGK